MLGIEWCYCAAYCQFCAVFTVYWLKIVFSVSDELNWQFKPLFLSKSLVCIHLCFPDDKVWTVVNHNSTEMVRVQGSSLQKPHVMKFNYSASLEQLRTLVGRSEQCQQEVVYLCRKSRLFNTWGGYWTTSAICVLRLEFFHLIFLYYSISALFQLTNMFLF